MALDVRIAQIQFIRQAGVQDEQVMSQGGPLELGARHVAKPGRLKPGPSEPLTRGSVVASDAFFPCADGLIAAIEAGATAVIEPGGSVRDADVIAAADEAGAAMVFTGLRHFRH